MVAFPLIFSHKLVVFVFIVGHLLSLVMHRLLYDQIYTIVIPCHTLDNQVHTVEEVIIWPWSLKVTQKNLGGLLLPYLETKIFKNQISPIFWGFYNTSDYQYAKWVSNTLTICMSLFLNLDHSSGQVCTLIDQTAYWVRNNRFPGWTYGRITLLTSWGASSKA